MKKKVRKHIEWLRARDLKLMLMLAGLSLLVMIFLFIADEVMELDTEWFDHGILLALRDAPDDPIGPYAFEAAVMHISGLGSGAVATLIVVIACVYMLLAGHKRYAALMLACSLGTLIVMQLSKGFFERPRPTIVTHIDPPGGLSFPSGHSMISAAMYMTLAVVIARTLSRRRLRIYVVGVGALLAFLIGLSRLYLGVHYPTDVLAGWTLGLAWALVCGIVARKVARRVDSEVAAADKAGDDPAPTPS